MLLRSLQSPSRYAFAHITGTPFFSIDRAFQRATDERTSTCAKSASPLSVRLDVKEDEKSYTVIADLPGVKESDVEVTFDEGVLTIRGEKKLARDEKTDTWHITERSNGSFARQITLPDHVKADGIEAKFDKGVLSITVPKEPEAQKTPTKIAIKTS